MKLVRLARSCGVGLALLALVPMQTSEAAPTKPPGSIRVVLTFSINYHQDLMEIEAREQNGDLDSAGIADAKYAESVYFTGPEYRLVDGSKPTGKMNCGGYVFRSLIGERINAPILIIKTPSFASVVNHYAPNPTTAPPQLWDFLVYATGGTVNHYGLVIAGVSGGKMTVESKDDQESIYTGKIDAGLDPEKIQDDPVVKEWGFPTRHRFPDGFTAKWKYYAPPGEPLEGFWYDPKDPKDIYVLWRQRDEQRLPIRILNYRHGGEIEGGYGENDQIWLTDWNRTNSVRSVRGLVINGDTIEFTKNEPSHNATYPDLPAKLIKKDPRFVLKSFQYWTAYYDYEGKKGVTNQLTAASGSVPYAWATKLGYSGKGGFSTLAANVCYEFPNEVPIERTKDELNKARFDVRMETHGVRLENRDATYSGAKQVLDWAGLAAQGAMSIPNAPVTLENESFHNEVWTPPALKWEKDFTASLKTNHNPQVIRFGTAATFHGGVGGAVVLEAVYEATGDPNATSTIAKGSGIPPETGATTTGPTVEAQASIVGLTRGGGVGAAVYGGSATVGKPLSKGETLKPGSIIRTNEDTLELRIVLSRPGEPPQTINIALGKGTRFNLEKFEAVYRSAEFALTHGKAKFSTEKLAEVIAEVSTSVVKIRNWHTVFSVEHDEGADATTVRVEEGTVDIVPKNSALSPLKLAAGQQVTVTAGEVSPVTPYEPGSKAGGAEPTSTPPPGATAGEPPGEPGVATSGAGTATTTSPPGEPPAAGVSGMRIEAEHRRVAEGELVHVPVWLKDADDVANINFEVHYDAAVARPEGDIVKGNLLGDAIFSVNPREAGRIRVGFAQTSGLGGTGTLAQLPMRAVGKPGQRTPLHLEVTAIDDPGGAPLTIRPIDGSIIIVGPGGRVLGDCDGDAAVTAADAMCALKMSVGNMDEDANMDADEDGVVTSGDARVLLREAVGSAGP